MKFLLFYIALLLVAATTPAKAADDDYIVFEQPGTPGSDDQDQDLSSTFGEPCDRSTYGYHCSAESYSCLEECDYGYCITSCPCFNSCLEAQESCHDKFDDCEDAASCKAAGLCVPTNSPLYTQPCNQAAINLECSKCAFDADSYDESLACIDAFPNCIEVEKENRKCTATPTGDDWVVRPPFSSGGPRQLCPFCFGATAAVAIALAAM